jgi:hypothetical protein
MTHQFSKRYYRVRDKFVKEMQEEDGWWRIKGLRFEEFKPKGGQGRVPTEWWIPVYALRRLLKLGRSDKGSERKEKGEEMGSQSENESGSESEESRSESEIVGAEDGGRSVSRQGHESKPSSTGNAAEVKNQSRLGLFSTLRGKKRKEEDAFA